MPIQHVVKAGESVASLAEKYGLFAPTIWDAPENAALKALRPDMNTLLPGDELFIPDLRGKTESVAPDQRHQFRRKGVPARFRIQLYDFGEPRANQVFTLVVDKTTTIEGTSDGDGVVEATLPPNAQTGRLTIGEDEFEVELAFGRLDPLSEISGVQQRLTNLGYDCGRVDGEINARTREALRRFQLAQNEHLTVSGELDDATRDRLGELHDAVVEDPFGAANDAGGG